MSFISYAQNFEDVMLWRALKHVKTGFYIDVGANDPDTDSVTKAFYEHGWRGINIEPVPQWFQRLQEGRVRDINLQMAVGNQTGEITLYEIPDTGLSTADKSFAERHQVERGLQFQQLCVHQDTLANLCERYHIAPIHFLKVDVEGMEKAVLEGTDFTKIRPWILLVESTLPNSTEECFSDWEPILQDAGYQYAYGDGLNRFYVAEEHSELLSEFQHPPNVLDDFILSKHLEIEAKAGEAESKLKELELERLKTKERLAQSAGHVEEKEAIIAKVQTFNEQLQNELNLSVQKVERLEHALTESKQELASKQAELQQERERSQWLQNEWDAAKAKIDELEHSSHHWWSVADSLNQALQSIYHSKFWRLTWPFRKAMQGLKAMFQFLLGLVQWPKKAARWFLSKSIVYALRHDKLKRRARQYLYRHPTLEAHLRAFSRKRGLIPGPILPSQPLTESTMRTRGSKGNEMGNADDLITTADITSKLTPRARRIYAELKSAIEKKDGGAG